MFLRLAPEAMQFAGTTRIGNMRAGRQKFGQSGGQTFVDRIRTGEDRSECGQDTNRGRQTRGRQKFGQTGRQKFVQNTNRARQRQVDRTGIGEDKIEVDRRSDSHVDSSSQVQHG